MYAIQFVSIFCEGSRLIINFTLAEGKSDSFAKLKFNIRRMLQLDFVKGTDLKLFNRRNLSVSAVQYLLGFLVGDR